MSRGILYTIKKNIKIEKYFNEKENFLKKKNLLKYFDKNNVKKYCVKEKCENFSFNVFNNFLYNKEI